MPSQTSTSLVAKVCTKEPLRTLRMDQWRSIGELLRKLLTLPLQIEGLIEGVLNHRVGTYEQTKKGLSYFYPKRTVLADGNHAEPLKL